jgi:hypothetical protein
MNKIENWIHETEGRVWFLFECRLRGVSYMNACKVAHPSRALAFSQTLVSQPAVHHANR